MSDSDARLDLLQKAIADSGLPGQMKDALADDLQYAQEINGTQDASLLGIKRLVISGIRRELLIEDRMGDAIKHHIAKCPALAGDNAALPDGCPHGQLARWVSLLTPWRWPVALVCFSPFAGDIVSRVIRAVAG